MSPQSLDKTQLKQYANKLNNNGIMQISGDERITYLQGQVTTDINKLTNSQAQLACHCDFKGKMWSLFYAFAWQDSILLMTHDSVLDKSLAELNKYGVFAKVEITNQSDKWLITGGAGTKYEKAIVEIFEELPTGDKTVIANDFGLVMSIEHPSQRYLVLQPSNSEKLLNCDATDDNEQWEIADIQAGIGDIREITINEYVPQMLNLQALNAIDFEKGCYMGQEVVARTKYLGRNKRAGFVLKSESTTNDLTGEQLEYQIGENWRPGGKILRSGKDLEHTWIFAVLANDTEIGSSFRVKSSPDTIFVAQALPYPLQ